MRAIGLQYADSCFHCVVLTDCGEIAARKTIRANYSELRREFHDFEPTFIAVESASAAASMRWVVELLQRLDHAVQIAPRNEQEPDLTAERAASMAEQHARRIRNQWKRGIAAMRAASLDTAHSA